MARQPLTFTVAPAAVLAAVSKSSQRTLLVMLYWTFLGELVPTLAAEAAQVVAWSPTCCVTSTISTRKSRVSTGAATLSSTVVVLACCTTTRLYNKATFNFPPMDRQASPINRSVLAGTLGPSANHAKWANSNLTSALGCASRARTNLRIRSMIA